MSVIDNTILFVKQQLENAKAKLEAQKINAKLILDDNNQSYAARLAALAWVIVVPGLHSRVM